MIYLAMLRRNSFFHRASRRDEFAVYSAQDEDEQSA